MRCEDVHNNTWLSKKSLIFHTYYYRMISWFLESTTSSDRLRPRSCYPFHLMETTTQRAKTKIELSLLIKNRLQLKPSSASVINTSLKNLKSHSRCNVFLTIWYKRLHENWHYIDEKKNVLVDITFSVMFNRTTSYLSFWCFCHLSYVIRWA